MAFSKMGTSRSKLDTAAILDLWPLEAAFFVHKMADSIHDAQLIKNRRSYTGNQTAGVGVGLLKHCRPRVIRLCRQFGLLVFQMIEGLELHDRPGQVLGQPVMDFVGDGLPLMVAGLQ